MPVSREEYQKLVNREMARYKRGNTGGETVRDKAVRAANVAAGYGNSTALKYPVRPGGGGKSLSRDGDGDGKTNETPKAKSFDGGPSVGADPGGPPGMLSDENAGPVVVVEAPPMVGGPPGRLSPENAGPGGGGSIGRQDLPVFMLGSAGFNPIPTRDIPPTPFDPAPVGQVERGGPLPAPSGSGVFGLPGEPVASMPTQERFGYDTNDPRRPGDLTQLLQALGGSFKQGAATIAPWLQDRMFNR